MAEGNRTCPNCGTTIQDRFCSHCGQRTEDRRGPLVALLGEALGEFFSLDSRLVRSLRDLFLRPGALTEKYLAGQRASQLPPLRLYLVSSVVFFFLFSLTPPDVSNTNVFVGDQVIGRAEPDPDATAVVQLLSIRPGNPLAPRLEAQRGKFLEADPQQLIDTVYDASAKALSRAMILFLPMVALILKLLYVRCGRLYYDHVIFAAHVQSFLFSLLSLSFFAPLSVWLWLLFFLLITISYMLFAMRRVYQQSWMWTVIKGGALVVSYVVLLGAVFAVAYTYVVLTI